MSELLIERDGAHKRVRFNRPEQRNALSASAVETMLEILAESETDGTRLLELSGEGRNFCAGFDLSDLDSQSEGDLLLRFVRVEQMLQAVHHAPFHTLALAHGKVVGAGADLVLACRTRIAAPGTQFEMPGAGFGLILGTRRLAAAVGNDVALDLLSGPFVVEKAQASGFVQEIVAPENWPAIAARTLAVATRLAPETERVILGALRTDSRAADLADLVVSAARPGVKQRIAAYAATRKGGSK
jgi:enoyl-CoA hydratase/carnithine racemase